MKSVKFGFEWMNFVLLLFIFMIAERFFCICNRILQFWKILWISNKEENLYVSIFKCDWCWRVIKVCLEREINQSTKVFYHRFVWEWQNSFVLVLSVVPKFRYFVRSLFWKNMKEMYNYTQWNNYETTIFEYERENKRCYFCVAIHFSISFSASWAFSLKDFVPLAYETDCEFQQQYISISNNTRLQIKVPRFSLFSLWVRNRILRKRTSRINSLSCWGDLKGNSVIVCWYTTKGELSLINAVAFKNSRISVWLYKRFVYKRINLLFVY